MHGVVPSLIGIRNQAGVPPIIADITRIAYFSRRHFGCVESDLERWRDRSLEYCLYPGAGDWRSKLNLAIISNAKPDDTLHRLSAAAMYQLAKAMPRTATIMALPFFVKARYDAIPTTTSHRRAASLLGLHCGLMGNDIVSWWASVDGGSSSTRTARATGR